MNNTQINAVTFSNLTDTELQLINESPLAAHLKLLIAHRINGRQGGRVYGFGINDCKGESYTAAYKRWASMLNRCYCLRNLLKYPQYVFKAVCPQWLTYSNFKAHYLSTSSKLAQGGIDIADLELDSDALADGQHDFNYSPETSVYMPQVINTQLASLTVRSANGLPAGVSRKRGKYRAQINQYNWEDSTSKMVHLGTFNTPEEAHAAYSVAMVNKLYELRKQFTADSMYYKCLVAQGKRQAYFDMFPCNHLELKAVYDSQVFMENFYQSLAA
ncbi:hypothetical protein [Photobacterium damselae]|uniref:AP2/ERF domain-containing protein n=1 Tax=Photobacterium damselae TaxID=38293 RepID=A0ABD6X524_PHODM|nr:hypothetical protein [Photobacterium damselae]OBU46248.1 hypothetical protein AYY27_01240 [Photobacterium damselae]PSU18026.1 hypothetical protein CTM90_05885 [Photobacterium damselae]